MGVKVEISRKYTVSKRSFSNVEVISLGNNLETACRMHGVAMEKSWAEQFVSATVDAALMAQNVLLAAESLGISPMKYKVQVFFS